MSSVLISDRSSTDVLPKRMSEATRIAGLIIATYPINLSLVSALRIVDFVIMASFVYLAATNRLSRRPVGAILGVLAPLVFSAVWGLTVSGFTAFSAAGAGFVVKYFQVAILVWLLCSLPLDGDDRRKLLRLSAIVFWIMVAYVYARIGMIALGIRTVRELGGIRPDFPFTPQQEAQNAGHLVGAYLATGAMMWTAYLFWRRARPIYSVATSLVALFAVLLTGSRGPIIALLATTACLGVIQLTRNLRRPFTLRRHTIRVVVILLAVMLAAGGIAWPFARAAFAQFLSLAVVVLERTFLFTSDLTVDASLGSRVTKAIIGIESLLEIGGGVIGAGPFLYPAFFDNGVVRLLHDLGSIGFIVVSFIVLRILRMSYRRRVVFGMIPLAGLLTYLFSNLTAEFFLVSRSVVPVVVVMWLLLQPLSAEEGTGIVNGETDER